MKKIITVLWILITFALVGCLHDNGSKAIKEGVSKTDAYFFGDSSVVLTANDIQNGYQVSFINNKQIVLVHFERGDSISRYCALDRLPECLRNYEDSMGVFSVDINIPVVKVDTLGGKNTPVSDIFFMDVNFDGEEEFLLGQEGNGWVGYTCYDLAKGTGSILNPMQEEPYNSISYGIAPCQAGYTVFDYQNKEIFIQHSIGASTFHNIWAKYFEGDSFGNAGKVKVVKIEEHEWKGDGLMHVKTFKLVNDTLKLVEEKDI